MSGQSAIDNKRGNRRAEALAFADFRTLITYGWDSARAEEDWITLCWFMQLKFMVLCRPVVRWLARLVCFFKAR